MSFTNYDLNERAVLAMYERFQNNLNSVIDAINSERGTLAGITPNPPSLAHPALILSAPPVKGQLANFPVVAIGDGDIRFVDDVGWAATGVYEMMVLAYDVDTDPTMLAWKMRRWAQALISTAMFGRQMTSTDYFGAWGVTLKRVIPGPRLSRTDPQALPGQIVACICVLLELKDEQNPVT